MAQQGWPEKWIEEDCNIFDYKQELECDLQGSVQLIGKHAIITRGEIKSSTSEYKKARMQMWEQALLIEFVLERMFGEGKFTDVIKKGYLFVLGVEDDDDDQREKTVSLKTVSLFVLTRLTRF
jgi:hypothetical protein